MMMMCICYQVRIQPLWKSFSSLPILSTPFLRSSRPDPVPKTWYQSSSRLTLSWRRKKKKAGIVRASFLPVDPWAPNIDSQSIATQLFAASLFPYIGFLFFITKSKSAPKLTLFGFYFLLAFVGATIPAGIYAKVHYGTSLSNVDWLHGGAESLLTLTNLFIVLGLRAAIRKAKNANASTSDLPIRGQRGSEAFRLEIVHHD